MSSMYTVSPASLHDVNDHSKNCVQPRHVSSQPEYLHNAPATPESDFLSPYSSHARSNSASSTLNSNTPADAIPTAEVYPTDTVYTVLECSEDPFLGTNFDDIPKDWLITEQRPVNANNYVTYPQTPHLTPCVPAYPSFGLIKPPTLAVQISKESPTLQEQSIDSVDSSLYDPQLTPDTNQGSWSSNDIPEQTALAMAAQSPRVMVSMWGKGGEAPIQGVERSFATDTESPCTVRPSRSIAGDLAYERSYEPFGPGSRDNPVDRTLNGRSRHRGLAPEERTEGEILSPNQQAVQRQREEKNRDVNAWLSQSTGNINEPGSASEQASGLRTGNEQGEGYDNIPTGEIPLSDTENKYINGQAYLLVDGLGGPLTDIDYNCMQYRPWEDPPTIHAIQDKHFQPETSQAAIERFQRQCQDNASIISRTATWGTRRRSLPSIADIEEITAGKVFKKLSISGNSRRPSLLQRVTSLSRKTSLRKRKGSSASEQPPDEKAESVDRRGSKESVVPSSRASWVFNAISKRQPHPSLSDAVLAISTSAATIGSSINRTHITTPKSPRASLDIRQTLGRPRSKSEVSMTSNTDNSHPNIVGLLKGHGGPPVAQLARTQPRAGIEDDDDDDDDDDEGMDENGLKDEQGNVRMIEPTLDGFKAHILACNPGLAVTQEVSKQPNNYLVERMAQQLLTRFHQLLIMKQNHMKRVHQGGCPSGSSCRSLGGATRYLDNHGANRAVDSLPAKGFSSDAEAIPLEGAITAERFPQGIILPPATSLPAEFECPLCYTVKRFLKPSDWTKHIHEDVQPFTCTWDRCRDPKMFKRKADWVRHENEGHRQLEWWTCDVDDCHHVCYRRDNFLQHLVREHKFVEPKVKTKVAMKRSNGLDRTWQKVEQCHEESHKKSIDEPCRFCGKTFNTWKKLTVHLAKHMEQICLPIVGLVMEKELDLDTIIAPVQSPLARHSAGNQVPTTPSIKPDTQGLSPLVHRKPTSTAAVDYFAPNMLGFSPIPQATVSNTYFIEQQMNSSYHGIHSEQSDFMMQARYNSRQQYDELTAPTASFEHAAAPYTFGMTVGDTQCFPAFDSLGIQGPTGGLNFQHLENPAPTNLGTGQYRSHHGSVSPFARTSHQDNKSQFYKL
ncbi:hypothetical protein GGR50DRAFT_560287 [Xylaria sp. CBS 124048]|nr:hypothetical protein GGR50DRAFT_560287 [Xylaria sp. CBS 124048]